MASDEGPECERCDQTTVACDTCHGEGSIWGGVSRVPCNQCDETGYVCPEHGKRWRR